MIDYSELTKLRYDEAKKRNRGPLLFRIVGWIVIALMFLYFSLPFIAIIAGLYDTFFSEEIVGESLETRKVPSTYTEEDYQRDVMEEMRMEMRGERF